MAVKSLMFRRKFPLSVTDSLLALQPVAILTVQVANQFDYKVSATGGWDYPPLQSANANLPLHPAHTATPVSTVATGSSVSGNGGETVKAEPTQRLATESGGRTLRSRSANYSHLDWTPREKLTAAQSAEIGSYCGGSYIESVCPGIDDGASSDESPTYIPAKASHYEQKKQIATLAGDVVLCQGSMQVEGDEVSLHQLENRGELVGNVKLCDKGTLVAGGHAQVQLDNGEAQVGNAEYVIHRAHARGSVLYAKRSKNAIIMLRDGTYTHCEPSNNARTLRGNDIRLNPATDFGTMANVTLRARDFPVSYTPYIYFPIDDRRQSGFLPPSFSSTSGTSLALVTPYCFNLTPNCDATSCPRYMAKRGVMLEGEFRCLAYSSEGMTTAAHLNDKGDRHENSPDYNKDRWLYGLKSTTGLDSCWLTEIGYTRINNPYYFQGLDSDLGVGSTTYLNQRGTLTYRSDALTGQLDVQVCQLATTTDVTPYGRLLQITFNGFTPHEPGGVKLNYSTEFVRLDQDSDDNVYLSDDGSVQGRRPGTYLKGFAYSTDDRIHLELGMSLPMT